MFMFTQLCFSPEIPKWRHTSLRLLGACFQGLHDQISPLHECAPLNPCLMQLGCINITHLLPNQDKSTPDKFLAIVKDFKLFTNI